MESKITKKQAAPFLAVSFPEYSGRKFKVNYTSKVYIHNTYWSSGSKSYYCYVPMDGGQIRRLDDLENPAISMIEGSEVLLDGSFVIVEHCYYCGADMGIIIHAAAGKVLEAK